MKISNHVKMAALKVAKVAVKATPVAVLVLGGLSSIAVASLGVVKAMEEFNPALFDHDDKKPNDAAGAGLLCGSVAAVAAIEVATAVASVKLEDWAKRKTTQINDKLIEVCVSDIHE